MGTDETDWVPLRRPDEWEKLTEIRVVNPDGWRHGVRSTLGLAAGPRDWDEPITRAEFDLRVTVSTIEHVPTSAIDEIDLIVGWQDAKTAILLHKQHKESITFLPIGQSVVVEDPAPMMTCGNCRKSYPASEDCGGDCASCMAEAERSIGDHRAAAAAARHRHQQRPVVDPDDLQGHTDEPAPEDTLRSLRAEAVRAEAELVSCGARLDGGHFCSLPPHPGDPVHRSADGTEWRPAATAEPAGVWVSFMDDNVAIFATEIEALRHAVENHQSAQFCPWGEFRP